MRSESKFSISLGVVLAIAGAVLFWRLGSTPLTNWDEGIYAEVARTMHAGGSWWLPTYHGLLFLEKPPLTFWLMNAAMSVFGVNEFAVRFWSAIAGVATAGLLTLWTWQLRKKAWLAILAGLIFVSGRFMFFHAFRTGDTDALLVFFSTLTLYSYWRTKDNQRWWWLVGVATGLAVMTKSFVGLLPQVVIGLDLLLSRGYRKISWRRAVEGLGWLLLIAVPWHLAVAIGHGPELWRQAIGFNLMERSSTTIASINAPWYWYGPTLFNFFFPWSAFVPLGVLAGVWRWLRGEAFNWTFLLWVAVIFFAFAFSATKYDHYIQPLYPILAILIALMIENLTAGKMKWLWVGFWLSTAWLFLAEPTHFAHRGFLWKLTPYGWLPQTMWQGTAERLLVAALTAAVILLVSWALQRRWKHVAAATVMTYALVMSFGWQYSYIKHLPATSNAQQVAERIARKVPKRIEVFGISHVSEPALYFYLGRLIKVSEIDSKATPSAQTVVSSEKEIGTLASLGYSTVFTQGPYIVWDKSQR